jgi:choline dehydrogenase-like flavoprotein
MLIDLQELTGGYLDADVCVIGAGAAGITIAMEFLHAGADVIVLESGGFTRSQDAERLNDGEAVGIDHESLTAGRMRVLGGATARWGGQCLPADPDMFNRRPWVPQSGWPFALSELEHFYRRAEKLLRIENEVYDERIWDRMGVVRPATDPTRVVHRFTVWCPQPHLGRLYRRELMKSTDVRLLLGATATELVTDSNGERFGLVRVATSDKRELRVRARACVLCTGGIENARLLLVSRAAHPNGIGNQHDAVGRYFQDHPNGYSAEIAAGDSARLQELYGMFYSGRKKYLPRLVLSTEVQRSKQVLECAAYPVFDFGENSGIEAARRVSRSLRSGAWPNRPGEDLGLVARDLPRLVSTAYRRVAHRRSARTQPAMVTLQTHAEQAPNPDSRVTIGQRRDPLGIPIPIVDWKLTELDRRTAAVMVATVGGEFSRLGLGEVRRAPWVTEPAWQDRLRDSFHHMGTTRLGEDLETSVVDPDCQVHGVERMFVAGSSVFPAAGYVNPTLTIIALAIRLADHLKRVLGTPQR